MTMEITVNVDNLDLDTVIGEHRVYDHDAEEYGTESLTIGAAVVQQIVNRLYAAAQSQDTYNLSKRIADIRDDEIRKQVAPVIAEALAKRIQQTNSYGEPTGKTTTLNELIVKEANAYLSRRVDQYGRNDETVVRKFVREAVEQAIKKELAEAIADEKAKVVAAVRLKAADLIAQAVKEGIGR